MQNQDEPQQNRDSAQAMPQGAPVDAVPDAEQFLPERSISDSETILNTPLITAEEPVDGLSVAAGAELEEHTAAPEHEVPRGVWEVFQPYLKQPWKLVGNIGRSRLFREMLSGSADREYFRLYSNKEQHAAPLRERVFNEVCDIACWLSHPEQNDFSITYFGAPLCIVRERAESGRTSTGVIGKTGAFALATLRFYQDEYAEVPEVFDALKDVEKFFSLAPNINYEATAWWLIATMVMRESDEAELVKAIEECHAMILVAETLAPLEVNNELTLMEIQAAKERALVESEELIPSFDFRVHAKGVFDGTRGRYYGTAVGFYEVKRVQSFKEASDLTSVIKTTVKEKLEKPYMNPGGHESTLQEHPSLKALIIQVPWPKEGEPLERRRKKGYRIFESDGTVRYGYVRNGVDTEYRRTSIFDEVASNLERIPGAKALDAVYLCDLGGALLQTFYHHGETDDTGMVLAKPRVNAEGGWRPAGDTMISMRSYFKFHGQ